MGDSNNVREFTFRFSIPSYLYSYLVRVSRDRGCTISGTIRDITGISARERDGGRSLLDGNTGGECETEYTRDERGD